MNIKSIGASGLGRRVSLTGVQGFAGWNRVPAWWLATAPTGRIEDRADGLARVEGLIRMSGNETIRPGEIRTPPPDRG